MKAEVKIRNFWGPAIPHRVGLYLLGLLLFSEAIAQGQVAAEAWVRRYNSEAASSQDEARRVVADSGGNVIIVGFADAGVTGKDMLTIKYTGAGVPLWTNRYNGPANNDEEALAVAVDRSGNVFVSGNSTVAGGSRDYATIAYSAAGAALWTNYYNGPGNGNDYATSVASDNGGHVFVTGNSTVAGGSQDYATIAYSTAGAALWTNYYNGPGNSNDYATVVAVDNDGRLFVTGHSRGSSGRDEYATIAYSTGGVALWTNRFNNPINDGNYAYGLAVGVSGNVFVTGLGATIAYTGAGAPLWTNHGFAAALTLDQSGNVFVTGSSGTIAYTGAGTALWTNGLDGDSIAVDHNGTVFITRSSATFALRAGVVLWTNPYKGADGFARAVAVDDSGNVFVTGLLFSYDCLTIAYSGAGAPLWTNRYDGPGSSDDRAYMVAVDKNGNAFVTGYSYMGVTGYDYTTIAYSAAGVALWTNYYNGPANYTDRAYALAVDEAGNVFVTGESADTDSDTDFATIAYSGAGVPLWTNRYNGSLNGDDIPSAIAVDRRGNVFVAGSSFRRGGLSQPSEYATVAYSGAGVPLWTNRYSGPGFDNIARAMAVDGNGNVFVTGWSSGISNFADYATIAYSWAGVPLWTNRYDNGSPYANDGAYAVAVNGSGNVFVTGDSSSDLATVAYSGAGLPLWTNRYNGPNSFTEAANAIAVDRGGNVFVAGYSDRSDACYYITLAYSSGGAPLWTNTYKGGEARGVAVDGNGNVYVAGYSDVGPDYVTIAYSAASGTILWTNRYNGPADGEDRLWSSKCIAVGPGGAVYVTGSSDRNNGSRVTTDYATVKYVLLPRLTIQPLAAGSSTVNLMLTGAPESIWSIERALWANGPWNLLGRSLIGIDGVGHYEDVQPPIEGAFYRAAQP